MEQDCGNFELRISDCGLGVGSIRNPHSAIHNRRKADLRLPTWWRYMLVALSTLVFCSCQALPENVNGAPPVSSAGDVVTAGDVGPAIAAASAESAPPPLFRGRIKSVEIRALSGEQVAASRPLNEQEIAAGYANPAPCSCACCGSGKSAAKCETGAVVPASCGPTGCGPMSCGPTSCSPAGDACISEAYGTRCEMPASLIGPPDEYLCDGGDYELPAGVRADWTVDGLEPEDSIAHYDTLDGRVVVTPSNRVCIYAPRFAAVRRVVNLMAHERRQLVDLAIEETTPIGAADAQPVVSSVQRNGVAINLGQLPPSLFRGREQPTEYVQLVKPGDFYNSVGAVANLTVLTTGELVGTEIVEIKRLVDAAVAWNGDQAAQVLFDNKQAVAVVGLKQPGTVFQTDEPGDPRLRLIKCASTRHALPGEEVEFTLRYDNIGDQVIGNVTIIDNLTTRLDYVPNTARSTAEASFSTSPNGTGSNILRWEIKEPLKPGEGGTLQFKCLVR
jgi:uncharacterized repeat protein (TIGR01451 family)